MPTSEVTSLEFYSNGQVLSTDRPKEGTGHSGAAAGVFTTLQDKTGSACFSDQQSQIQWMGPYGFAPEIIYLWLSSR